jgi:hypothetical protein
MVAGPYTSGGADGRQREKNLRSLNQAALAVWRKGHVPLIGINAVKPIIDVAGEEHYNAMMMPMCLALAEKCDAVLRVGGPSKGADDEVERVSKGGGLVFKRIEDIQSLNQQP